MRIYLVCLTFFAACVFANEPPQLSPDLVDKMREHAVKDVSEGSKQTSSKQNPVSVIDLILGQDELRQLNVDSVSQLPKDVLQELISTVVNDGPPPELVTIKRKLQEAIDRASSAPLRTVKGISINDSLNVEPGRESYKIRLVKNMDTIIEFYDQAGNPWPVVYQRAANDVFTVTRLEFATHILYVRPSADFTVTNLSILLDSVNTNFSFMLSTNDHRITDSEIEFDEQVRLTVPLVSRAMKEASASNPSLKWSIAPVDDAIRYFLNQTHFDFLKDVVVIPVLKGEATAYLYNGSLYVRTQYENFSYPGSSASSRPENDFRVYKSKVVEPVLTFFHDGQRQVVILNDDVLHTANQNFLQGGGKTGAYSSR